MKLHLDVESSLKLCPPSKNPYLLALPKEIQKQCHFVERKIIGLEWVTYYIEDQSRTLKVVQANASVMKITFELNGFIHTEYPPIVVQNSIQSKEEYDGLIGHTRDQSLRELCVTHMIYDVYKFDSPLAKRLFNGTGNQLKTPKTQHTKNDIVMQTLKAIDASEINNDDDEIVWFIDVVAADKSKKERKAIFDLIRGHKSQYSNLLTYHCGEGLNSTSEAAKKFNIPYKGDANHAKTNKLGYIPPYANPITSFAGAKKLIKKYGFQDVEFHFFLPKPKQAPALYEQRDEHEMEFDSAIVDEAWWLQTMMEQFGTKKSLEEIIKKLPYKKKGWLPCYLNPDPSKGGNPNEETIVDKNGNPVGTTSAKVFKFGT